MSVFFPQVNRPHIPRPSWHRTTEGDIWAYKVSLAHHLNSIEVPYDAFNCVNCTRLDLECTEHNELIDNYYCDVINALISSAHATIPKHRKKGKAGWNPYLRQCQEDSIFWHRLWVENGKPATGWVSEQRRKARAEYRRVSRWVVRNQEKLSADRMADAFLSNRYRDLWEEVKRKKGYTRDNPIVMDDIEGEDDVCNLFRDKYESLYSSVPYNEVEMQNLLTIVSDKISRTCMSGSCYSNHSVSPADVLNATAKLKKGKSDAESFLSSDNFINACDQLFVHLSFLLNSFFFHVLCS